VLILIQEDVDRYAAELDLAVGPDRTAAGDEDEVARPDALATGRLPHSRICDGRPAQSAEVLGTGAAGLGTSPRWRLLRHVLSERVPCDLTE
jgi:hypothetical protein